jgi:hypothetical protein
LTEDPQGKPGSTVMDILSLVQKFGGVSLSDTPAIPDLARINSELDQVWRQKRDDFFNGIGFRAVRTQRE